MQNFILFNNLLLFLLLTACAGIEPEKFSPSSGHIKTAPQPVGDIPELVKRAPTLPAPEPTATETYSVIVHEVPIKELLFALARDADINIDIDSTVSGSVTMNALDQSLLQLLERIRRQVAIRYTFDKGVLYIQADLAFLKNYAIDYVNLSRTSSSESSVSTQISSASGAGDISFSSDTGNNSTTDVSTESVHNFWGRLVANIAAILGEDDTQVTTNEIPVSSSVIPNPESGILSVRATERQHKQVQDFLDVVLASARRQVLMQATIVEVNLNRNYQAGIDWSFLDSDGRSGIDIVSRAITGTALSGNVSSSFVISTGATGESVSRRGKLTATVNLLDEFGDIRILSSPQMMVLNNQTALLKVVDNVVYFEIDSETTPGEGGSPPVISTDTTARTVPVGIVMALTPHIDASGTVTLNVRPTISRLVGFVNDPNPDLVRQGVTIENPVPRITVREMESVLRLVDGQIGILGGLMTDESRDRNSGLPGIKDVSVLGNLFKSESAQYSKTELVIFLSPTVINNPDIKGDLSRYQRYLDAYGGSFLATENLGQE